MPGNCSSSFWKPCAAYPKPLHTVVFLKNPRVCRLTANNLCYHLFGILMSRLGYDFSCFVFRISIIG